MTDAANSTGDEIVLLDYDGAVATVTINRPRKLNALNQAVMVRLDQVVAELEGRADVRVVLITGAGDRAFVAGADISELRELDRASALAFSRSGGAVLRRLERLPQAVVAVVNGFALGGGCELALACDMVIASDKARFGLPEVTLGVIPGFGGTQRLARVAGANNARFWAMGGAIHSAEDALRIGLAQQVVAADELTEAASKLAQTIAAHGPLGVAAVKRVIDTGLDEALDAGLESEAQAFAALFESEDRVEGTTAFLDKRKPAFQGR